MSRTASDVAADTEKQVPRARRRRGLIIRLGILAVAIAALAAAFKLLPVDDYLIAALRWVQSLGALGPAFVVAFYIVACVLMVPGFILTVGAGFLFGPALGTVTVSIGSTLGACAAFLVGRTVARDSISRKVAERPKFAAVDEAVGKQGFKIVLLTRLSPIFPFNLQNYAYGLTKVRFWTYALASWIGMLPGTFMYVYIGAALGSLTKEAIEGRQKTPVEYVFFTAGLAIAIVVAVVVTRVARKALAQAVPESQAAPRGGEKP